MGLFSSQGYRATSMKDISGSAGTSTGRVYHHFQNKLVIFTTLLDRYWERLKDPQLKLNKLSQSTRFPDDFDQLVEAIREVVVENQDYIKLIYIDVIEFKGEHIHRFYANMADNFRRVYGPQFDAPQTRKRFHEKADPLFAVMMTFRFFFQYFLVETSFGVEDHFGYDDGKVMAKMKDLMLYGLLGQNKMNREEKQ